MKEFLLFILHLFLATILVLQPDGVRKIAAENALLRQQLLIVRRRQKRVPKLSMFNRLVFGMLVSVINPRRLARACLIVKPSTVLKFHQVLVKRKYRLLFASHCQWKKPGPKGPSQEVIDLVLEMKRRNPRFGCRRIAMQVSNVLNIQIDKDDVRRILIKFGGDYYKGDGPSWLNFFAQMKDSL